MNVLDTVSRFLGDDTVGRVAESLGIGKEAARSAVDAAVPTMLAGVAHVANSSPDGAQRVAAAVDQADEGMLSGITSMLSSGGGGGAGRSLTDSGTSMLSGLFGGGMSSGITDAIARYTGLGGGVTGKLLAMIAPFIFGALNKTKSSMGLDAGGLANLLSSQKGSFMSALPSGLSGVLGSVPGLSGLMGSARSTASSAYEGARSTASSAYEGARAHIPAVSKPSYSWVVPACIAALLGLGLLWWWGSSRTPDVAIAPKTTPVRTTPTVVDRTNDAITQGAATADDAARTAGAKVAQTADAAAMELSQQTGGLSTTASDWFTSATKTIEGIKDSATADAAIPEIDSMSKQLDTMSLSAKALPTSSRTKFMSSIREWRDKLKPMTDKVLAMPAIGDKVKPSIEGMYKKIDALIAE